MVASIKKWISRGKKSTRSVKKYKAAGKNELKNKSISEIDSAYAVARSVKQKGIKKTGFLDKAITSARKKIKGRLGKALKIDIINSIK